MSGTGLSYFHGSLPWSRWWPVADVSLPGPRNDILLIVLISLLTLATFLALFVLRSLDDNRLTSWQWTVTGVDAPTLLFVLAIGVFLAYLLSSTSFPVRKPAIWLFISSFSISAIFWGEPEIIVDTSRYFVQAKYLELYGVGYFFKEWGNDITVWTDLPLVPLLYGLVFKVFGEYRTGIQIFNTLLFSGTVVLTYLIGKSLWDKTVGLYGGILLLGMPYLLTQVPLMLVDVPTMFFFTLAIFTTIMAVRHGGTALLISASVTIVLAMLSKYSVWLMLSVMPVILMSHTGYGWKVILQRAAMTGLGALLLIGAVIFWKFNVFVEQLNLLQTYQVPGLRRWGESFISTFFFQVHPYITLAALFSIYSAFKKKDFRVAIISWLLILVVVLEINRARYLVVVFPMLALMASYGINEIRNAQIRRFIVASAVVSALVTAMFGYLPFSKNTSAVNLKQAGIYLDTLDAETIEVVVLPRVRSIVNPAIAVPMLDLFTSKNLVYRYDKDQIQRPASIEKSSLRFTWEYRNPEYYLADTDISKRRTPVAIIFSDRNQIIPAQIAERIAGYRLVKDLSVSDGVFKYQTIVRVYQPV